MMLSSSSPTVELVYSSFAARTSYFKTWARIKMIYIVLWHPPSLSEEGDSSARMCEETLENDCMGCAIRE
jgi:hypothetical protein